MPHDSTPKAQPPPDATPSSARSIASALFQGVLFLAYPFAIYWAHTRLETRVLSVVLLGLLGAGALLRLRGSWNELRDLAIQHLGVFAMIAVAFLLDDRTYLLFLPAAVSLYLLFTFGASLRRGPPMIERFARIVEDDLPDFTLPYCRATTKMWCAFFALNAAIVCVLAVAAPLSLWAIYTGGLFYVLLGSLLAGEFVFRKIWFRYYTGGAADGLLARLFPAEASARGRRSLAYQRARAAESVRSEARN